MVFCKIVAHFVILFWMESAREKILNMAAGGLVGFINSRGPIQAVFFSFGYLFKLL